MFFVIKHLFMTDMVSELSEVQFASIVIDVLIWDGIIDTVLDVLD